MDSKDFTNLLLERASKHTDINRHSCHQYLTSTLYSTNHDGSHEHIDLGFESESGRKSLRENPLFTLSQEDDFSSEISS